MAEFKISTNIERDANLSFDYIVTKNANEVYDRIIYNYNRSQRSFTIIGSYGTGKSTFLWAFEKHLKGETKFSKPINTEFNNSTKFDFVRIIGDSSSFRDRFCETFGFGHLKAENNKTILKEFNDLTNDIAIKKRNLILLVDEFGKHLEYISKSNPDEMYFIQELAEFCNDTKKNVLFITTLHQNFSVYSKGLTKAQKSEWDKVRGRLVDVAFDEPVEQLMFFASQRLSKYPLPGNLKNKFEQNTEVILNSFLLGKSITNIEKNLEDLYPLDPLSADILTKSLQRYGQNERSLFSFLESADLKRHIETEEIFHVANCFDYLIKNLSAEIEDGEKNPFKPQWKAAVVALEKAEFLFQEDYNDAAKIIKTICLVNIFSNNAGKLDETVLLDYAKNILGINNGKTIIHQLVSKGIIKFSNHRSKFNFIEGTDVDIEQELIDAVKFVDSDFDLVSRLESYFEFSIIPAKRYQFLYGAPRFFAFRFFSDFPIDLGKAENEIDGYINLIFTKRKIENLIKAKIEEISSNQIFVLFKDIDEIKETLFEIDKINFVISKYLDDKVALRILNEEKLFRSNKLKDLVEGGLFSNSAKTTWIWNRSIDDFSGIAKRKILSFKHLNQLLSDSASVSFNSTPIYRNEMVNKEYLSTPILTARKALIKQMINSGDQRDLGFSEKTFPPEKTIYLSLLKNTGIHKTEGVISSFSEPTDKSFSAIWEKSLQLLNLSSDSKIPVSELITVLKSAPFKLKQGLIDFWIPIFLIIKKEDYSLYYEDGEFIPMLTPEVLDLIHKHPGKYFVKALSTKGVKTDYLNFYKELVGYNESNIKGLQSSYITIYGNFLRFYRSLEEYSKKTKNLSSTALGIRNAIASAQDPESALFNDIPDALGYYNLEKNDKRIHNFLDDLQLAIRQIRSAYDLLVDSIENQVAEHLKIEFDSFDSLKDKILKKFRGINKNLILNDALRVFYSRVVSPLDVKKAYWESLCDVTIGKKLDKIQDEDISLLVDRLKANFDSLLDLADLHNLEVGENDNIYQVSITDRTGKNNLKKNILVSSKLQQQVDQLETKIHQLLSEDDELNKIVLITLLEKALKK